MAKLKKTASQTKSITSSLKKAIAKKSSVKAKRTLKDKIQKRIGIKTVKAKSAPEKCSSTKKKILKTKKRVKEVEEPVSPKYHDLEQKYNVTANIIGQAYLNITKLIENHLEQKNSLFRDEQPVFLQFCVIKIPSCPRRILRIPLKHSLLTESSEVCLILPDPPGLPKRETERVNDYYEGLLKSKNITNIKTVIPYYQLRTEYGTFELKRRLVELYDAFLVDGRISGYVVHHLGKIFYQKRKVPTSIKFNSKKVVPSIESALKKTPLMLHSNGDFYTVQVGHTQMQKQHIVDNVFAAIEEIEKQFPGGWNNIRNVNLRGPNMASIPIYVSLKNKSCVKLPVVSPKRPKAFKPVKDELTTYTRKTVTVLPSGDVIVKKLKLPKVKKNKASSEVEDESSGVDEDIEDIKDILEEENDVEMENSSEEEPKKDSDSDDDGYGEEELDNSKEIIIKKSGVKQKAVDKIGNGVIKRPKAVKKAEVKKTKKQGKKKP